MRAAFYQGARTFTTGEMAPPRPGPDDALLRVRRVGICGTDLHIFQGHLNHRVPKGGIIGHETFGEIRSGRRPLGMIVALITDQDNGIKVNVRRRPPGGGASPRLAGDVLDRTLR